MWKLDESLPELLSVCGKVLSASPVFILLNVYTTVLTLGRIEREAEALRGWLKEMLGGLRPTITAGELALEDAARRRMSASVFSRAKWVLPQV
jgi:hypothetical protein